MFFFWRNRALFWPSVFHLLTCLELYEGAQKYPSSGSNFMKIQYLNTLCNLTCAARSECYKAFLDTYGMYFKSYLWDFRFGTSFWRTSPRKLTSFSKITYRALTQPKTGPGWLLPLKKGSNPINQHDSISLNSLKFCLM